MTRKAAKLNKELRQAIIKCNCKLCTKVKDEALEGFTMDDVQEMYEFGG